MYFYPRLCVLMPGHCGFASCAFRIGQPRSKARRMSSCPYLTSTRLPRVLDPPDSIMRANARLPSSCVQQSRRASPHLNPYPYSIGNNTFNVLSALRSGFGDLPLHNQPIYRPPKSTTSIVKLNLNSQLFLVTMIPITLTSRLTSLFYNGAPKLPASPYQLRGWAGWEKQTLALSS
eukprot:2217012-Amphidinium_carterae.1